MNAVRQRARHLALASALIAAAACGGSSTSPTSSQPMAALDGMVKGFIPNFPFTSGFESLAGATVAVVAGPGAGTTTVTDDSGIFHLQLPGGAVTLQYSADGYSTAVDSTAALAGARAIVTPVLTRLPSSSLPSGSPWTVSGVVTDSSGNPASGASVTSYESLSGTVYGTTSSDAGGRFRFQFIRGPIAGHNVVAASTGQVCCYITTRMPFPCCGGPTDLTVNLQVVRIISATLTSPTALRVGESLPVTAVVQRDDGAQERVNPILLPSLITNVGLPVRNSTKASGEIEGVFPGTATLVWSYYGFSSTLSVRVSP